MQFTYLSNLNSFNLDTYKNATKSGKNATKSGKNPTKPNFSDKYKLLRGGGARQPPPGYGLLTYLQLLYWLFLEN